MENSHQFNHFLTEINNEYNPEVSGYCYYLQLQNPEQLELNNNDRSVLTPIPTPPKSLSSTDWTNSYATQNLDIDHLAQEWSEAQFLFGQNWSQMENSYVDLNPVMAKAQVYFPSDMPWPLDQHEIDASFDRIFPQATLPANCCPTEALPTSENYPTPVSSTSSANSDQYNNYSELDYISETSRAPLKAGYSCETCGVVYLKKHLLNDHRKIHNPSLICPVQGCTHRAAKSRDMDRHLRTEKHKDYIKDQALPALSRSICPVPDCKNGRRGFARKDHLQRHLKKHHPDWLKQER